MNYENSPNQSLMTKGSNEISVYKGQLTKRALVEQTKRILNIFPKFPQGMLEELKNAFADNNFTDERMKHAVDFVRDTYTGWNRLPNIADFIQYDKKIKTYTYKESLEYGQKYLVAVDTGIGQPRWIKKEDQEIYKIKLWENK